MKILLGTDALAEGLNLQTCGVEINYDAPWNPMRLEQRIGRIDRIGQQHDRVWIWTYFYEGTVEAEVYSRLWQRIGWITGVVGSLQPILHRVERTIQDLALTSPEKRQSVMPRTLDQLVAEIERVRAQGFDLDAYLEKPKGVPQEPKPPVTLGELEGFLTGSALTKQRFRAHPEISRAYLVKVRGREVAGTFDPTVADAHPDSLRLLTFGDRVLDEILADAAKGAATTGKLLRITTEDSPRRFVVWYGVRDDQLIRIESLADLIACLEQPTPVWDRWEQEAREDFFASVKKWREAEQGFFRKRAKERLATLWAKGRETLVRAAYVWAALTRLDGVTAEEISGQTLSLMIEREGYPFGPLAQLVGELPKMGGDGLDWGEIEQKTPQQLEGLWQWVRMEAKKLVEEIRKAEEHLKTLEKDPPLPQLVLTVH